MTIYSDAIGNKFLGDCIWANHDIAYPTTKFLQAHPYSSISAELTALCTQAGLKFRNVLSQASFNSLPADNNLILSFGASSDTIDDRYSFASRQINTTISTTLNISMYNNNGGTGTTTHNTTNSLMSLGNIPLSGVTFLNSPSGGYFDHLIPSQTAVVGVSDGEMLALFWYQTNANRTLLRYGLQYAGLLEDVNTNYNYYSDSNITKSILMTSQMRTNGTPPIGTIGIGHYIANVGKLCLTTGDAQYPIVCADAQTPTSQWATDMYVFDNNAPLGYPAIGRVRNLLLAQGSYTIGKPVKIQGSAMPDAGFNRWLPIGVFAGKTVLMRCYSSVDI